MLFNCFLYFSFNFFISIFNKRELAFNKFFIFIIFYKLLRKRLAILNIRIRLNISLNKSAGFAVLKAPFRNKIPKHRLTKINNVLKLNLFSALPWFFKLRGNESIFFIKNMFLLSITPIIYFLVLPGFHFIYLKIYFSINVGCVLKRSINKFFNLNQNYIKIYKNYYCLYFKKLKNFLKYKQ